MRRLSFLIFLISTMALSQIVVYADSEAVSNKVYVPLPYMLSTLAVNPINQDMDNQVDLSTIAVNRGVFSYFLFRMMTTDVNLPPIVTMEQKIKYNYEKYNDKRFEPVMKDYTIWAMEAGYLSQNGKANHLLRVSWLDIQSLFAALQITPTPVDDYSIYDSDKWGFVTDSEKELIGMFNTAFGRGVDTRSIERQLFTLTIADMIYLLGVTVNIDLVDITDEEMQKLTGYRFFTNDNRLDNGLILSACFPYTLNSKGKIVIVNIKNWAKKEGFINYEG